MKSSNSFYGIFPFHWVGKPGRDNLVPFGEYIDLVYGIMNWDELKEWDINSDYNLATIIFKNGSNSEILPFQVKILF